MRCLACNCQLDDHEATRKFAESGTFVDLCNRCFSHIEDDVVTIDGAPPDNPADVSLGEMDDSGSWEDNL